MKTTIGKTLAMFGAAGIALQGIALAQYSNCCQMSGTVVGCSYIGNHIVVCSYWPPQVDTCTGSSPGTPFPSGQSIHANGKAEANPNVDWCGTIWVTATGTCCGGGGAVTGWHVVTADWYGYVLCEGNACGPGY
jgi:hypothetical protein